MMSRVLPIFLLLVAVGLFFGYVHPTYTGEVATLRAQIAGYNSALEAAARFSQKEAALLLERESIPAEGLARLEAFLPDGVDNVQLIVDLDALAQRSGLDISDFNVEVPEDREESASGSLSLTGATPTEALDLSVSAVGSYDSFKAFLLSAERSLRPMDLVQLGIQDSDTGVYSYSMTFRIYWLR